jgi:uncharacterized protein YjbK
MRGGKHGREVELKLRIPRREDFLSLRDDPRWGTRREPERQVNHYFDTPDGRLVRSRVLLRVREEGGRCVLTLKCGSEVRPGLFDSLEIEEEIESAALEAALRRPATLLDLPLNAIDELKRHHGRPSLIALIAAGRLENERVKRETGDVVLDVDRIIFPDGSEAYELEIETDDPPHAEAWILATLAPCGIILEPQRLTKLEQLLQWRGA